MRPLLRLLMPGLFTGLRPEAQLRFFYFCSGMQAPGAEEHETDCPSLPWCMQLSARRSMGYASPPPTKIVTIDSAAGLKTGPRHAALLESLPSTLRRFLKISRGLDNGKCTSQSRKSLGASITWSDGLCMPSLSRCWKGRIPHESKAGRRRPVGWLRMDACSIPLT